MHSLDECLACVLDQNLIGKPYDLKELNRLLKVNRKHLRGELCDSPLDQKALSIVAKKLEEIKRDSGRIFLSLKFEFSRIHPTLYIPVIFERSVS